MVTRGCIWGLNGRRLLTAAAVALLLAASGGVLQAQTTDSTNNETVVVASGNYRSVGGVSINAEGLLTNATTDAMGELKKQREANLEKVPAQFNQNAAMRKISLRRLDETLAACMKDGKPLPDAMRYLAGLQHVEYVFVYPEQRDIVLVGPGEGWKVDAKGTVVGIATNRPVMLLDDLIVALRTAKQAAEGGIFCSIDPTPEGLERLKTFLSAQKQFDGAVADQAEKALGMQDIRVSNVLGTSHFGRVLVAADYRMKRLAMGFEPSPVRGLPSYLQMVPGSARAIQSPRFWLEPRYEALLRDADGTAWNLRGSSVKAMTEEDFITASGKLTHSGKAGAAAQKWADLMTRKYSELAAADPIFGQLQNCMELAVVGAIVTKERLAEKAGNSLPMLLDSPNVKLEEGNTPKQVASVASVVKRGHNWVMSVSGGVAINSWVIADQAKTSDEVAPVRAKAIPADAAPWAWD